MEIFIVKGWRGGRGGGSFLGDFRGRVRFVRGSLGAQGPWGFRHRKRCLQRGLWFSEHPQHCNNRLKYMIKKQQNPNASSLHMNNELS